MALSLLFQPTQCSIKETMPRHYSSCGTVQAVCMTRQIRCMAGGAQTYDTTEVNRRSANFKPSSWNHDFLESIGSDRQVQLHKERAQRLEEEVRLLIDNENSEPLELLESLNDIHRVGLDYRYRESIQRALDRITSLGGTNIMKGNLCATAIYFRLLRQYGFEVSADVFESFQDQSGNFKLSLSKDVKGLLSLYEASHLAFEGEKILDDAKEFTSKHLKELVGDVDPSIAEELSHAMELPSHYTMLRLEAWWHIEAYSKRKAANPSLVELAKVDFNKVQSTLQRDLRHVTRWWRDVGLADKLSFARDRMTESFFWGVGMAFEPQYSECRKAVAKAFALVTVIDDVYDVYGAPDELELFTDAVERWDIDAVADLPDYMKICFLALYNTVNDLGYITLKEQGDIVIPYLKKAWADLCKAFLQEAKWSNEKSTPPFQTYLDNARVSVSGCVLLIHAFFLMNQKITEDVVNGLMNYHDLLKLPSIIFRLTNDLSTSTAELARGETTNSIPCYMNEVGCSEEVARKQLSNLIDETWKKMNKELVSVNTPFERSFIETAINLARISKCQYQYGDGHGDPDARARQRIASVIIEPIPFTETEDVELEREKLETIVNK